LLMLLLLLMMLLMAHNDSFSRDPSHRL